MHKLATMASIFWVYQASYIQEYYTTELGRWITEAKDLEE